MVCIACLATCWLVRSLTHPEVGVGGDEIAVTHERGNQYAEVILHSPISNSSGNTATAHSSFHPQQKKKKLSMRSVVISRSSGSHGSTLAREVAGVASAVARAAQNVANNDPIFASASSSSACADDPPQSPTPGRVVVVDNLPEPRLAPDCLQIRVEAASLNALDADMRRGIRFFFFFFWFFCLF